MKISEIRPGMRGLEVNGRITSIGEIGGVHTKFGPASVASAVLEDETATVRLNLWRNQTHAARPGDRVKLINAFSREFGRHAELNICRNGRLVAIERGEKGEKIS